MGSQVHSSKGLQAVAVPILRVVAENAAMLQQIQRAKSCAVLFKLQPRESWATPVATIAVRTGAERQRGAEMPRTVAVRLCDHLLAVGVIGKNQEINRK